MSSTLGRVQSIFTTAISSYLLWTAFTNTKRAQRAKLDTRVDPTTISILTNRHLKRNPRIVTLRPKAKINYDDIA